MRRKAVVLATLLATSWIGAVGAQSYDPARQSPMTLLVAPPDPVAYHDAREQVRLLLDQDKAAEAEPLAERIVREYPRDGENWLLLGSVKEKLQKFAEAAAANERAGQLMGFGLTEAPAVRAARTHLLAGNRRAALDLLHREVFERGLIVRSLLFDSEWFASLRTDPEFLEIVGRPDTSGWSRDYGWRRDIQFLRDEVRRVNPDYRDRALPEEFERRYQDLLRDVPRFSDEQIFVGMNRLLAVLHQGHTGLSVSGTIASKRLPFDLWAFPEGLFIINALEQHRDLVGARLLSIEGVEAEEILRRVNELQSVDGDNEYLLLGPSFVTHMAYLRGLGIAGPSDTARIRVQRPGDRERTLSVEAGSARFPIAPPPPPGVEAPLFLRDTRQRHWDMRLPEQDAIYVQFNMVAADTDETLEQFGLRLRTSLAENAPQNMILDMRHNIGGTTATYPELLRTIIAFSQLPGRRLFVLIGRLTYSAAANFITDLERLANPIFVGEASSECCSLYGDPSDFTLPYSRLSGRVSGVKWNLSRNVFDERREISPHVPVLLTADAYFRGRDPALDAVFRMISRPMAGH